MAKQHRKEKSIWPSWNKLRESASEKALRQTAEAQAKLRSQFIDQALEDERQKLKKEPKTKILLLGPSEAGKSTVLKNFQITFSPTTFQAQVEAWLPVIHLNLVRTLNSIVDVLELLDNDSDTHSVYDDDPPDSPTTIRNISSSQIPHDVKAVATRLRKLQQIERELETRLSPSETPSSLSSPALTPPSTPGPSSASNSVSGHGDTRRRREISRRASEISIRPGVLKQRLMDHHGGDVTSQTVAGHNQTSMVLSECAPDMVALWEHPWVRRALTERDIHLEYQSGFFLNDIPRLTSPGYRPTSEDILRSRIHTPSAEEHRLTLENTSSGQQKEWIIYDVGGVRSQRAAWAQYFDDITVVLYVASLSAFNETLAEDISVNRLTDSLLLWQTLCSNKLLASVDFVLFLNKVDLLKAKLEGDENADGNGRTGLRFVDYVNSFKSRPNDVNIVAKYMNEMFISLHRQHSPPSRKVYSHFTCAIDAPHTTPILHTIRDIIVARTTTL